MWAASPEFYLRLRLRVGDSPDDDLRLGVIFGVDGLSPQPREHRDLAYMRQRIGDGTLNELLRRAPQSRVAGQQGVKPLERREETRRFISPRQRLGVLPPLVPFRERVRPVEQVAEVGEN